MQNKVAPLLTSLLLLSNSLASAQQGDSVSTSALSSLLSDASVGYDRLESLTNAGISSFAASGRAALSQIEDILATANPSQISVWESAAAAYATDPAAYSSLVSEVNSAYEAGSPTASNIVASSTATAATPNTQISITLTGTNMATSTGSPITSSEALSSVLSSVSESVSSVLDEVTGTSTGGASPTTTGEGAACAKEVKYGALAGAAVLGAALML